MGHRCADASLLTAGVGSLKVSNVTQINGGNGSEGVEWVVIPGRVRPGGCSAAPVCCSPYEESGVQWARGEETRGGREEKRRRGGEAARR